MKNIASVVISNCTREFDKEYYYYIPDSLIEKVAPGVRVIVPFGKSDRSVEAYVMGLLEDSGTRQLKSVKKVIDESPVLDEKLLRLAGWMKRMYICTYSDAIKSMLPPGIGVKGTRIVRLLKSSETLKESLRNIVDALREAGGESEYEVLRNQINSRSFSRNIRTLEEMELIGIYEEFGTRIREKTVRVAYIVRPREEIIEEIESNRIKRIQQIRILEMLLDNDHIAVSDLIRFASVSPSVLNTLRKYGYIDFKEIEVKRSPYENRNYKSTFPLIPTNQQAVVLANIKEKIDRTAFSEILLHGVTGSGKTEIYLQLIQYCLDKGKQAIVLVPEISLTPQMVERFMGRFGRDVAVLHSRLSPGERYDQWRMIKEGRIKVAVGARSAVFAPFRELGIIIIDEEHENTYKSEMTPKYHARDIARQRCLYDKAILLYGSATPSIENYYKAKNGEIDLMELSDRANNMVMPQVDIVDMRDELSEGNRSVFSRKLAQEIKENIKLKQQTILFLNRRGYASFVLCRKCGYTLKCVNCNISLTYHAHDERLICHYCGYTIKVPELCPKCKSNYIRQFGSGTQKVEEELKKHFDGCSVLRMDMDTTAYKNAHEEILKNFSEKNINVMVGTQMIAKGHDFPNVTLVGVLAADSLLNTGDYRAAERTFQLITQVAGRAGRGELPGRVVIQTYNTDDFSIIAACSHDYISFYNQEIKVRERLEYPPYTNIAVVLLSGLMDKQVFYTAKNIKSVIAGLFVEEGGDMEILGPSRAPLSKIKNKFRWRIIIKCKNMETLLDVLSQVSDKYYQNKKNSAVVLSVDINPANML